MAETYPDLTYSEIRSTRVHQHVLNSDAHWQRYAIDIHLEKQERSDLIDSNHLRLTIVSSCKSQARRAGPGFEVCSFDLLCIWSQCALNLGFHCLGGPPGGSAFLGQARAADDTKQWLPDFLGVLSSWS